MTERPETGTEFLQRTLESPYTKRSHRRFKGDTIMFYYPPMLPKPDSPPKCLDW